MRPTTMALIGVGLAGGLLLAYEEIVKKSLLGAVNATGTHPRPSTSTPGAGQSQNDGGTPIVPGGGPSTPGMAPASTAASPAGVAQSPSRDRQQGQLFFPSPLPRF